MNPQPEIKYLSRKKLVGKRLKMSLARNRTRDLWESFMPRRAEIRNNLNNDLISLQVYDTPVRLENINQIFEKWALVEVADFEQVPAGMEKFTLNDGLYAVFQYRGLNTDKRIFIYIFSKWLPKSDFELDERPHFEVLGVKYKNGDPNSEEEIWIPVRPKNNHTPAEKKKTG